MIKKSSGSSTATIIFLIFVSVVVLLIVPYPYYSHGGGWYFGTPLIQRLTGSASAGLPVDKVVRTVFVKTLESPMNISCKSDNDCTNYSVINQCRVYCGNKDSSNATIVNQLSKNRVCDPAMWKAEIVFCSCILGKCIDIN